MAFVVKRKKKTGDVCKHDFAPIPAAWSDDIPPLYCIDCMSVQWLDGTVMTADQWNSHYDEAGNLLDPSNDPAFHNKIA